MLTVEELTQVFVAEIEADENTDFVTAILANARAAIKKGQGSVLGALTSTSVNGKSFTRAEHASPIMVLQAARAALKIYAEEDDQVSTTRADFSCIQR